MKKKNSFYIPWTVIILRERGGFNKLWRGTNIIIVDGFYNYL